MSSNFSISTLADLCSDVSYGYTESATDNPVGPKFLRITDIQGGVFDWEKVPYCPATESDAKKYSLAVGDIVVARTGNSTGENTQIKSSPPPAVFASYLIRFRPNPDLVNPFFVGYQLRDRRFQDYVLSVRSGSAQPGANAKQLVAFSVFLIDREMQDGAVELLKSLDDRITLLRETSKTLGAIVQAIFKSWFIDFDPVRAKMEGRAPAGLDEETAALFPDELVESELGLVPEGWGTSSIEGICSTITNGGTPSRSNKSYWDAGSIPWYKTGDFSDGFLLEPTEKITEAGLAGSSVKLLPENAVLMAIYAAPTVGRLGVLTRQSTFNQACTGMVAKDNVGTWFLYWTLFFGRDWFNSRANGAAQQNISKAIVAGYEFPRPTDELLAVFHNLADSIHMKVRSNVEQVETLATIRDSLLPRLISGNLKVDATITEML